MLCSALVPTCKRLVAGAIPTFNTPEKHTSLHRQLEPGNVAGRHTGQSSKWCGGLEKALP